jgi:hypothetical protein
MYCGVEQYFRYFVVDSFIGRGLKDTYNIFFMDVSCNGGRNQCTAT